MEYKGKYGFFDYGKLQSYPISERDNKVTGNDIVDPEDIINDNSITVSDEIKAAAEIIVSHHRDKKPVMVMMGAHPVKLGLGKIFSELINCGIINHIAGNGATSIHDFELALIGETSEVVPNGLLNGKFGMAHETGYLMNKTLEWGNAEKIGYGEAVARLITGDIPFNSEYNITHEDYSIIAAAYKKGIPVTIHATIGTDIIDQHKNADGECKGGCVGRDFGVFCHTISTMTNGGIILNFGSAVTMPEVLLKAVSMSSNIGKPSNGIITFDFDLRPLEKGTENDENKAGYYFRDQKSIVNRIPQAFGGAGHYIQGNFKDTIPALYKAIKNTLGEKI